MYNDQSYTVNPYSIEAIVREDLIRSFAATHKLPLSKVERFALSIAEHCALIANRFEPEGELEVLDLATVEAVGAEIGAAILNEFSALTVPEPTAIEAGWGMRS